MPARVVHHTHASLGPAWRRSHAGRNLTSLPTGKVGRPHQQRTVQEKVEGWVAVMGTRCTGGRPCTRSAACPTPWPVATHPCPAPRMAHGWQSCSAASSLNVSEPNSGNRPPLDGIASFLCSRAPAPLPCRRAACPGWACPPCSQAREAIVRAGHSREAGPTTQTCSQIR